MAENLGKRPSKGILKNSSSFEKRESPSPSSTGKRKSKATKWDEMNIIATLHPADKDYGHMKIDEPKTPYHNMEEDVEGADVTDAGVDATLLAEKIRLGAGSPARVFVEEDEDEEDVEETDEQKVERKAFESKRKAHYNEFEAVKLARSLMAAASDEEEEEENTREKADSEPSEKPPKTAAAAAATDTAATDQPSGSKNKSCKCKEVE